MCKEAQRIGLYSIKDLRQDLPQGLARSFARSVLRATGIAMSELSRHRTRKWDAKPMARDFAIAGSAETSERLIRALELHA
jgi:hypothetical protein